jgi:flagellar hook protein FlgE
MMGSLFSSISGLKNHTTWMNAIGNNISNVNTTGYKQTRVTFREAITQNYGSASGANIASNRGGLNPQQLGLGSVLGTLDTIMTQGAIQTTGNVTDVAIQGNGFFLLESGNTTSYTRAGNFYFDNEGNFVNSTGAFVQGWQLNPVRTDSVPGPVTTVYPAEIDTTVPYGKITIPQNMVMAPQQTGNANLSPNPWQDRTHGIFFKGNLDSMTPMGGTTRIDATIYDSLGNEHLIAFTFTQTVDTAAGGKATWDVVANDVTATNGVIPPAAPNLFTNPVVGLEFNADGSLMDDGAVLAAPNVINTIQLPLTNGAVTPLIVSVNFGTENDAIAPGSPGLRDGLTGDYGNGTIDPITATYIPKHTAYTYLVDGYSEGTLTGVSIDSNGNINCNFSNNQIITMAKLALANFPNAAGLEKIGDTLFVESANSGRPQVSTAGNAGLGTITSSALEASNVDLSVELTNMIIAQRGFESNARIVTTSADMLDTLVNLGR